ncbi:hypothetical protein TNCV_4162571, partial [Trichonephila clavipes]
EQESPFSCCVDGAGERNLSRQMLGVPASRQEAQTAVMEKMGVAWVRFYLSCI